LRLRVVGPTTLRVTVAAVSGVQKPAARRAPASAYPSDKGRMKRHNRYLMLALVLVVFNAAAATAQNAPPAGPLPPTNLSTLTSGTDVAFFWDDDEDASGYRLQVGTAPGASDVLDGFVGDVTFAILSLELGNYHWRVIAFDDDIPTAPSSEAQFTLNTTCGIPTAPFNLFSTVSGGLVYLGWQAPFLGVVTTYVVEVGSSPGSADRYNVRTASSQPNVSGLIPGGTYYIRIRAENGCGVGPASNEVTVVVGTPPLAPRDLTARQADGFVRLFWNVGEGTQRVDDFIVEAGSGPGLANLAIFATRATTLSVLRPPPGIYYVRVRARGPSGLSAPSSDVIVIVQ
jgi:Fibronectin type III domain